MGVHTTVSHGIHKKKQFILQYNQLLREVIINSPDLILFDFVYEVWSHMKFDRSKESSMVLRDTVHPSRVYTLLAAYKLLQLSAPYPYDISLSWT